MSPKLVSKSYEVDGIDEFIELAYERGWTDGLPVFPPTEQRIQEMLDYVERDPQEVIGVISPGEGIATVEKIAINSVMAGCKPEYMPVVITAVQALLDPTFEHMRVQCTTAGPGPLAIISGPVVKKLGFNYGEGAFTGTGHRANSTIGRAIRLILWNIGYGRPGRLSHATHGHPGRYCYLVAERPRDDGNPWEEFHVTAAGLKPEDSAVSMFPARCHDAPAMEPGVSSIEDSLAIIADAMSHLGHFIAAKQRLLVLSPTTANYFADAGWSKERLRAALLERARRPLRDVRRTGSIVGTLRYHWTTLVPSEADDDYMVPAMVGPHHLQILVTGGWEPPGGHLCVLPIAHGEMVTRKIDWSWD